MKRERQRERKRTHFTKKHVMAWECCLVILRF